jgi:integrase
MAIINAATRERDRLFMLTLWATGGRVSEVLALRSQDVRSDSLVLPNRKNGSRPFKRVYLPAGLGGLSGELLVWARDQGLGPDDPLFPSNKHSADGSLRALGRGQAWEIVRAASIKAGISTLRDGQASPIWPHLFRHSRVRQNLRTTRSLPIVQKQAGWARLQQVYLAPDDEEVRRAMSEVPE